MFHLCDDLLRDQHGRSVPTGFIGVVVQWLSSRSFLGESAIYVYLLGAFICGFCVCMLNTVVNPMLNILGGGGNKGNQYIQIGGTLNSLTGTLTPLLVGALIGTVTIPEPAQERKTTAYEHSAWNFRHFVLGAVAIFMYVGIEIGIPSQVNFYLADATGKGAFPAGFAGAAAIGGAVAAIYWLLMMVGRFSSTLISGKVSTRTQMTWVSAVAIILVLAAIFTPKTVTISMPGYEAGKGFTMFQNVPLSCLFLILCGLCTSVMWGAIFNLAVEGLGKYTEAASGIFMMLVVGGGIMPFIQDLIAKNAGYMNSYWLVVAMLGYLLFYALIGSKNVNKDIPVE